MTNAELSEMGEVRILGPFWLAKDGGAAVTGRQAPFVGRERRTRNGRAKSIVAGRLQPAVESSFEVVKDIARGEQARI